ncbi:hypothetical protein BJ741DRAFT_177067 [Chytriomyces cf. hyalinus JEL632]|nr:hypothetical protein BJ741DRAFT_177067 [Chytriomyces cf. hyalinus JEL632]
MPMDLLDEINSLRRLLQMPSFERINSSLLSPLLSTADCPSAVAAVLPKHTHTFTPSRRTLEAMSPEILDRIAFFVGGDDVLPLCHAVPYYKFSIGTRRALGTYSRILHKHGRCATIENKFDPEIIASLPQRLSVFVWGACDPHHIAVLTVNKFQRIR